MPPRQDYESARDVIIQVYQSASSTREAIEELENSYNISISSATLFRRLKQWNSHHAHRSRSENSTELLYRVQVLFFELDLTDQEMLTLLQAEGFQLTKRGLAKFRKEHGLLRRMTKEQYEALYDSHRSFIIEEMDKGNITNYGRNHLYSYFRSKGVYMSSSLGNRMYSIVRDIDPDGVSRRRPDANISHHKGEYVVPGPNHVWSLDGHMKLWYWGIEIYAAIDAYSRHAIYVYAGVSARTGISVLRMYIDTISECGFIPELMRTDRGTETMRMADAHYILSNQYRGRANAPLQFEECFVYGTSVANQRIESWWNQLSRTQLGEWRQYFLELKETGQYDRGNLADRIAFLAVYMPIIREVVYQFAVQWGRHKIRKQTGRKYGTYGSPYVLYNHPELHGKEDFRVPIDRNALLPFQSTIAEYDPDPFLPAETWQWCKDKLAENGFENGKVGATAAFPNGSKMHVAAYLGLRIATRAQVASHGTPHLAEIPRPTKESFGISQEAAEAFRLAGENIHTDFLTDFDHQPVCGVNGNES